MVSLGEAITDGPKISHGSFVNTGSLSQLFMRVAALVLILGVCYFAMAMP
jgi:succinate dehydrogenase hydrophobic anchor subunit